VASRPFSGPEPTLSGLVTSLTLSPTPNLKSIDIKLCLRRRVEVSCFSTTTSDAINTTKTCRAACDAGVECYTNMALLFTAIVVHGTVPDSFYIVGLVLLQSLKGNMERCQIVLIFEVLL